MTLAALGRRRRWPTPFTATKPSFMAIGKKSGLLIAGGGLAGSLAALAMAKLRPDVPLILYGEQGRFGGRDGWTIFESELSEEERTLVEPFVSHRWAGYYVAFPGGSRNLKAPCLRIAPERIDTALRKMLPPERIVAKARIVAVRDDSVLLHGGEKIVADAAIDAREAANWSMLDLAWRRYAARDLTFSAPHRVDRPVLVDATMADGDFAACLPLGEARMRVGRFSYGRDAGIPAAEADGIDAYVRARGWQVTKSKAREAGAVPVALGGDFQGFWRLGGARVAKLGPRGGLFNPLTGSPLGDALGAALLLTRQRDFSGAALHDLFERHATETWAKREFQRGFNAMLLRGGGSPAGRILERLYALDPALLASFHSGRPGLLDRRRIMAAANL